MEEKKRTVLAILISCIILLSVLYSFGLNFFDAPPEIVVADTQASPGVSAGPGPTDQGGIPVEVTPETVQSVIASMSRYQSYSRTLTIRYSWAGGSGTVTAQVMADGGWSRCDTLLASGVTEHSIVGNGRLWYWYDEDEQALECGADRRDQDLMQYLPTYEDVLELDRASITGAGYEEKDGIRCIYVEARQEELGYLERYWIAESSGLLTAAETEKEGVVVYAMSSSELVSPLAGGERAFTLPDGEVLHRPEG